jgi:hypothetical protein
MEYFEVGRWGYDPPKWRTEGEGWQAKYNAGLPRDREIVIEFPTYVNYRFAPAVDRWLTAIEEAGTAEPADRKYTHDGHGDHVKAAALKKVKGTDDPNDNRTYYTLIKNADHDKIDDAIADVLATWAAATMPEPVIVSTESAWSDPTRSLYE